MYQLNMSINSENADWFYSMEKVFTIKLKSCAGIIATKESDGRLFISIACENENKQIIKNLIKEVLTDLYLTVCKRDYLSQRIKLPNINDDAYKILIHTLVAFDREVEQEIVLSNLKINDNFAIDGFFNFRLTELKKRWNEISMLAINNSVYLSDEQTMNELLKFLLSAVPPKIKRLDVSNDRTGYVVLGKYKNSEFEFKISNPEHLLMYLINIAPLELNLYGNFCDNDLISKLINIFDAKSL